MIDSLGFVVHPRKSLLQPTQEIVYLGFVLKSRDMTVRLMPERAWKIKQACTALLRLDSPSIRDVATVVGLRVVSFPGLESQGCQFDLTFLYLLSCSSA